MPRGTWARPRPSELCAVSSAPTKKNAQRDAVPCESRAVTRGRHPLIAIIIASLLAMAPPAYAVTLQTVAGNGELAPFLDGGPATDTGLREVDDIAVLPDGGFLPIDCARVRRVGADGVIVTVAGTGKLGYGGDGGPATRSRIAPTALAVEPDGGFLIAECQSDVVRRVDPDGRISVVAGHGDYSIYSSAFHFRGDGGPAVGATLACPRDVAVQSDGGVLITDSANSRVRRVGTDGVISTIAGSRTSEANHGKVRNNVPATESAVTPSALAIAPDGSILVADDESETIRRIATDGVITHLAGTGREHPAPGDGTLADDANLSVTALAATPDGGFVVGNDANADCVGAEPTLVRFSDGRAQHIAGTGRFITDPPLGDELRGDGGPAERADLRWVSAVAVAPDGGMLVAENAPECASAPEPGLVRYLPPERPQLLAANFVRSSGRLFQPGTQPSVDVALTLPATVTITVRSGQSQTTTAPTPLAAGVGTIALPGALGRQPATLTLDAVDTAGR